MKRKSLLINVLTVIFCLGFFAQVNAQGRGASTLTWTDRGPNNIGGPIRAVVFDKSDASGNTLIAGAMAGGLWRSENLGFTWTRLAMDNKVINVSTLIQTADKSTYAGTGIIDLSMPGSGLYKSTDGVNFSLVSGTTGFSYINDLSVNGNNLYVATEDGLMYFDGSTWSVATSGGTQLTGIAYEVKTAANGLTIAFVNGLAYVSTNGSASGFQCVSTQEGVGSAIVNPTMLPKNDIARMAFAIAPTDNNILYATASVASATTTNGKFAGAWRSLDKGASWEVILPGSSVDFDLFVDGAGTQQGNNAQQVLVDPTNANRVFIGCINMYQGDYVQAGLYSWNGGPISFSTVSSELPVYLPAFHRDYAVSHVGNNIAVATDGGLFISTNVNQTWSAIHRYMGITLANGVGYNSFGHLITGTFRNGIQYIGDGANADDFSYEIYSGSQAGTGYDQIISSLNNEIFFMNSGSTYKRTDDKTASFSNTFLGTFSSNAVTGAKMLLWESINDPASHDSITYKIAESDTIKVGDVRYIRSNTAIFPFPVTTNEELVYGDSLVTVDPVQSKYFLGWSDSVYMAKNMSKFKETPVWYGLALVKPNVVKSLAVSTDGNILFVGLNNGMVLRVSNLKDVYTVAQAKLVANGGVVVVDTVVNDVMMPELAGRSITSISVDPRNTNHVIFTADGTGNNFVFKSTNANSAAPTFASIQNNLPKIAAFSSLIEMNNSTALFVGTAQGLYTSNNGGTDWTLESAMGEVKVTEIKQQKVVYPAMPLATRIPNVPVVWFPGTTNYGVIYVSTYGRGVWESKNFVGINEQPSNDLTVVKGQLKITPNPVVNTMKISAKINGLSDVKLYDLSGKVVYAAKVYFNGTNAEMTINGVNAGTYVVEVQNNTFRSTGKIVVVK
ncbi:MAG: T9SS type A sorting domain-containing protein [Sphingobacteriia bacterium]|nr:T9SS type A sorting domain-containing protein [Sphingobacteriia bacterium]